MRRGAPGASFNSAGTAEYYRRYKAEILAPLDPATVVAVILDSAGGKTPVLCCYEKPTGNLWCHRAMAAEWLGAHLNQVIPEFEFEALPQHEHALMPKELRRAVPPKPTADVTPFIGKQAVINGEINRVIEADAANPGQAIVEVEGNGGSRRFSTSSITYENTFGNRRPLPRITERRMPGPLLILVIGGTWELHRERTP